MVWVSDIQYVLIHTGIVGSFSSRIVENSKGIGSRKHLTHALFLLLLQIVYRVLRLTNKVGGGCWIVYVALMPRSYSGLEPPST